LATWSPTAKAMPLEQLRVTSPGMESLVEACVDTMRWMPRLRPNRTMSTSNWAISAPCVLCWMATCASSSRQTSGCSPTPLLASSRVTAGTAYLTSSSPRACTSACSSRRCSRISADTWVLRLSQTTTRGPSRLLVGGVEQRDVVGLGGTLWLVLAAAVAPGAVDQPECAVRSGGDQAADRDPAGTAGWHPHRRGSAAAALGSALGDLEGLAGVVLEASVASRFDPASPWPSGAVFCGPRVDEEDSDTRQTCMSQQA
jgi:hypothetical protein